MRTASNFTATAVDDLYIRLTNSKRSNDPSLTGPSRSRRAPCRRCCRSLAIHVGHSCRRPIGHHSWRVHTLTAPGVQVSIRTAATVHEPFVVRCTQL